VGGYSFQQSGALEFSISAGVIPLTNGSYVVDSLAWNAFRGAITWGSGGAGITGTISPLNSLVGSNAGDVVGGNVWYGPGGNYSGYSCLITPLSNGNYVVGSPVWNDYRGAATWGNGSTGTSGTVSATNSLVGKNGGGFFSGDWVGLNVTPLSNGNYVVGSPYWNSYRGAATWGNGSTGISGTISAANSLVGRLLSPDSYDHVGFYITPLSNGNYVVESPGWNNNSGAATWGNGSTGTSGMISAANSLIGSNPGDQVAFLGVTALSNGNYVVDSSVWNNYRGAATWGNGSTGISGTVSKNNSLIGSNSDQVGQFVTPLSNGNYVVDSPNWTGYGVYGAATWGDGSTGIRGTIAPSNSLVGIGSSLAVPQIAPLNNGNYVVSSDNAATWEDGNTGVSGTISAANSLVGTGSPPQSRP
jgi:hypothetical protein